MSSKFATINHTYEEYGTNLGAASRLLTAIKRRVTMQDLVFYICFYLFLATCGWFVLKRFGVPEILQFVLWALWNVLHLFVPN